MSDAITAKNLSVKFAQKQVLNDITFGIQEGEMW